MVAVRVSCGSCRTVKCNTRVKTHEQDVPRRRTFYVEYMRHSSPYGTERATSRMAHGRWSGARAAGAWSMDGAGHAALLASARTTSIRVASALKTYSFIAVSRLAAAFALAFPLAAALALTAAFATDPVALAQRGPGRAVGNRRVGRLDTMRVVDDQLQ